MGSGPRRRTPRGRRRRAGKNVKAKEVEPRGPQRSRERAGFNILDTKAKEAGASLSFANARNASSNARKASCLQRRLRCGARCKKVRAGARDQTSALAVRRLDEARSFADEPHDHVDIGNLEVLGRFRQTIDANRDAGDIDEPSLGLQDRKSTRLNSSHVEISYAVFCLKK